MNQPTSRSAPPASWRSRGPFTLLEPTPAVVGPPTVAVLNVTPPLDGGDGTNAVHTFYFLDALGARRLARSTYTDGGAAESNSMALQVARVDVPPAVAVNFDGGFTFARSLEETITLMRFNANMQASPY